MFKIPRLVGNEAQHLKHDFPTWLLFGYKRNLIWEPGFHNVMLVTKARVKQRSGWLSPLYFKHWVKCYPLFISDPGNHYIYNQP